MVEEQGLIKILSDRNYDFDITHHEPLFTVEDSKNLRGKISGAHSKNLFLKDQKNRFYLVSFIEDITADLKAMSEPLNSKKLSFARESYLDEYLGLKPGAVTPFGLLNDTDKVVNFFFDEAFLDFDIVNFHPLINTATISMSPKNLIELIEDLHKKVNFIDMKKYQRNL